MARKSEEYYGRLVAGYDRMLCLVLDHQPLTLLVAPPSEPFTLPPWPGVFGHATDRLRRVARGAGTSVHDLAGPAGDVAELVGTALAHLCRLDQPGAAGGDGPPAGPAEIADRLRAAAGVRAAATGIPPGGPDTPAGSEPGRRPPSTERERALATIWQDVLKVPAVSADDDFYALGGDSMTAIQVVWLATQAGIKLVPSQLAARHTLAQLSAGSEAPAAAPAEQGRVDGEFPATGAQLWFFAELAPSMSAPAHFNHPYYLRLRRPIPVPRLAAAVAVLANHHDGLRQRFHPTAGGWRVSHTAPDGAVPFDSHDLSGVPAAERERAILDVINERHRQLDLGGPLARVVHLGLGDAEPDRLLVICHHLVTDGVSRALLLADLQTVLLQLEAGRTPELPAKTTAYRDWAHRLADYARGDRLLAELPFWEAQAPGTENLPVDLPGENRFGVMDSMTHTLDADLTLALRAAAKAAGVGIHDLLVWAAVRLAADRTGRAEWTVATTGHGRESLFDGVDLARTVGWFQVMYPVRVRLPGRDDDTSAALEVAEQLRRVPVNGIGYGLLRHAHPDPAVRARLATPDVQLTVNYAGAFGFDDISPADELFELCPESLGVLQDPGCRWPGRLDIVGTEVGDRLRIELNFGTRMYRRSTVRSLLDGLDGLLRRLAGSTATAGAGTARAATTRGGAADTGTAETGPVTTDTEA